MILEQIVEDLLDKRIIEVLDDTYRCATIGSKNDFDLGDLGSNHYHVKTERFKIRYEDNINDQLNFDDIIKDIIKIINKNIDSIYKSSEGKTIIYYEGSYITQYKEISDIVEIEVFIGAAGVIGMKEINQIKEKNKEE